MAEDKFEQALIDKLKSEVWEYLTDHSGALFLVSKLEFILIIW